MNILDELYNLYRQIDGNLATTEASARMCGDLSLETQTVRHRELNDQAFFLYMFTKLEEKVRERSMGRAEKNLSLMKMVEFMLPVDRPEYTLFRSLKKQRDMIAHGETVPYMVISFSYSEMRRLFRLFE